MRSMGVVSHAKRLAGKGVSDERLPVADLDAIDRLHAAMEKLSSDTAALKKGWIA